MNVESLRREAWLLKIKESMKHAEALDYIARREGFKNWMRLIEASKRNAEF